ncbi:hypothetical protein ACIBBD_09935 [Streptomyces sp. NPDC051315]|uniref:hypothetical protein n=1 Tax=Streptomyces sp. NPDC051315 TaxID=3365650 RepID=UPI00378ED303
MDGTPQFITRDPASGMLMIPAGKAKFAVGVGLWDDTLAPFSAFVQRELSEAEAQAEAGRRTGRLTPPGPSGGGRRLHVTVQLVPRPDNAYNPHAISVAAPPAHGGTDIERHLGYMYDRNLVSLGGALRSLAALTDHPLGCHAFVDLEPLHPDDVDDGEDVGLHARAADGTRYAVDGPRLMLPWWEELQTMAVACARTVRPDLILALIGHWAPWEPGAREELAHRTRDKEFTVTLRSDQRVVRVYYEELCLSTLEPGLRGFFDRTVQRVEELGGTATARAEEHQGALKLFVEDSTALTGV